MTAFAKARPKDATHGPTIFINYRRADCEAAAQHLAEDLERYFGSEAVFLDQKRIEAGAPWPKVLQQKLESSKVLLACIGEKWPEVLDDRTRDNRLNDKNDWVRRELELAKQKRIAVIPILLEGRTEMPMQALKLRKSLAYLANIQPLVLRKGAERESSIQNLLHRLAALGLQPLRSPSATEPSTLHPKLSDALAAHGLSSSSHNEVMRRVRSSKVIRIGLFRYPPLMDYDDSAGVFWGTGLYADILKRFAKSEGLRLEWHPINLSAAIPAVVHNHVDCYACIMMSEVRYRECDFVGLLHSIAVVGVVLKEQDSIKHPSDLTNRQDVKVAVCQGEIGHHTAVATLRVPARRLIEVNSDDISLISAHVLDGSATVALADAVSCKRMLKRSRNQNAFKLVFADPPILTVPNGFMIAKDNPDFSTWLDTGLRRTFATDNMHKMDNSLCSEFGNSIIRW